jgi:probable LLM family oxidoreductase
MMELGIYSFGDTTDATPAGAGRRLRDLLDEIALADAVGLDVYGIGEHHRPDYTVSAPAVVLAAAAARTRRIRLTSAVSVLSSDDPVRVYQQYATLDHLSDGRAEVIVGRGSFIESFPLFGYRLDDYDALFAEKLELLLALRRHEHVSWRGTHRPPIDGRGVYPRAAALPVWVAVGGTPESVVRAATLGLPLALAIIGGAPERFAPLVQLYRSAAAEAGHDPALLPVSINSPGYIADDRASARAQGYPGYAAVMTRIGRERGWGPMTPRQFEHLAGPRGALVLGSPDEVIEKILYEHALFGHQRFLMQIDLGMTDHRQIMRAIELYGTVVAPAVRRALGVVAVPA